VNDTNRYRICIYCTSSATSYINPASVEFPIHTELKINSRLLHVNVRGIKNRPGTVNPVDITKCITLDPPTNTVEINYAQTQKVGRRGNFAHSRFTNGQYYWLKSHGLVI
jgi:E3 SUMO-protein ligase PIAS1